MVYKAGVTSPSPWVGFNSYVLSGVTEFSPTCIKTIDYTFKKDGITYNPPSGFTFFKGNGGGSPVSCNYGGNYCTAPTTGCTSPDYGFY